MEPRLTSPDRIHTEVQRAIQFPPEVVLKGQAIPPVQVVVLLREAADHPHHIVEVPNPEVLILQVLPHLVLHQVEVLLPVAEVVILPQEGDSLKQ